MAVYPAPELAALRALAQSAMQSPATLTRRGTRTDAGRGGSHYQPFDNALVCRVVPLPSRSGEQVLGTGALGALPDVRIWFPAGTDVQTTDRITVAGVVYEVQAVELRGGLPGPYDYATICAATLVDQ